MRDQRINDVHTNVLRALGDNLRRHSVALVDLNGWRDRRFEDGSGVLVAIDARLFVATVAHIIPANPEKRIYSVPPEATALDAERLPILRHGKTGWPDVGFLELDPRLALSMLGKEAIGLDRISLRGPGDTNHPCFLFAYPFSLIRNPRCAGTGGASFKGVCYSNIPITPTDWPSVGSNDHTPDQAVDIFLPYDEEEELCYYEENEGDGRITPPHGMSGGGLWQGTSAGGGLWSAEQAQLFGIQSRWGKDKKYIRACQIVHWLRLLYKNYDDLRPTLSRTFPGLAP